MTTLVPTTPAPTTPVATASAPAASAPAASAPTPSAPAASARGTAARRATAPGTAALPGAGRLLVAQIGYQVRRLVASGRAVVVGLGLPVILLVASKGKDVHPDVAGYAAFGLTTTAWTTYGLRLVAARESGVLKRWRATPVPRWCYFVASILSTTLVAVLAGAVTILAALLFWGRHFGDGAPTLLTGEAALAVLVAFVLAALAWSSAVTALTSVVSTVESAFPILILTYFPVVIVSGVLFAITEPHWLSTLATYLPAEPLIDAMRNAVDHSPGAPFLPLHDALVLGGWAVGGLLAAVALFGWEPHRVTQRRPARPGRPLSAA